MRLVIYTALLMLSLNTYALDLEAKKELDHALKEAQLKYHIPAMAVAIISSGKVSYANGFGYFDKTESKSTTKHSLFRVASISKLFTAQAIMQLVETDKITLDDSIDQYLSSFQSSQITIRQLLTHSSGLKDTIRPVTIESKRTEQEYLDSVSASYEENTTTKTFNYSDTGFNILGSIVSSVSGLKFDEYIKTNILTPSHMDSSGYYNGKSGIKTEVVPTDKGILIDKGERRPYDSAFYPSEGLVSNINDLSKWLISTLYQDASLLQIPSYKKMLVPQLKTTWGNIYMGLGWQVYEDENNFIARHPGSLRGYNSLILSYPKNKNAIILLTNSSNAPRWEITDLITRKLKLLKF